MENAMIIFWLFCVLCVASVCAGTLSPYTQAIRERFEESFHSKCSKYPFLKQWEHKLEHTDDRFVTFMYHEPGLRNGGLGDRIAGLLNAVGIALRTNRTLLIESHNDFHELFQPYHSQLLQKGGRTSVSAPRCAGSGVSFPACLSVCFAGCLICS